MAPARTEPAVGDDHVPRLLTIRIDGHPFGMRFGRVVADAMRVDARDDGHVQLAAAADEVAEGVLIAEPFAAVMKRHVGRIKRTHAAGGDARAIGVNALEEIEPPVRIERRGILLDQCELHPPHRPVKHFWSRTARGHQRRGRDKRRQAGGGKGGENLTAGKRPWRIGHARAP